MSKAKVLMVAALVAGMAFAGCNKQSSSGNNADRAVVGQGGTFTLTDIPAEYNGKYISFVTGTEDPMVVGAEVIVAREKAVDFDDINATASRISNGKAVVPVWIMIIDPVEGTLSSIKRFSDDLTTPVYGYIYDTDDLTKNPDVVERFTFNVHNEVDFVNGSASKSWEDQSNGF